MWKKIFNTYIVSVVLVFIIFYANASLNDGENHNKIGYIWNNNSTVIWSQNMSSHIGFVWIDNSISDIEQNMTSYIGYIWNHNSTSSGNLKMSSHIGFIWIQNSTSGSQQNMSAPIGYIWNWHNLEAFEDVKYSNTIWFLKNNKLSIPIVHYNNPLAYNQNPITAQNINASPVLLSNSASYYTWGRTQNMSYVSHESSAWDPVILSTWEFDYDNTLMSYQSEGFPFEWKIRYRNQTYYNWLLWNNFDFNYNIYLTEDDAGNINYHDGKLWAFQFEKTSTGFAYQNTINATLTQSGLTYMIAFDNQKQYTFWLNSKIKSIQDAFGNEMTFDYNDNRELTKITDTLGREYTLSYYEHSRVQEITDFVGNKVEFIYFWTGETLGSQYDLKTIKMKNNSQEREISFTYTLWDDYESSHNLVKLIDSENNTYVENTYDENDRVASQTYGNGTIYYDYTLDNNKVSKNSVTDREWHIIEYFYDHSWNTTKKIIKKSSWDLEYNYVYDSKSNLIQEIRPLGNGIAYTYDENNNVIETRQKQNMSLSGSSSDIVSTATYNLTFNKPTQTIWANGLTTNYTYDSFWNILSKEIIWVKDSLGNDIAIIESFEYNSKWQLTKQINPRGLQTSFTYGSGNLLKITKWSGTTAIENSFEYDTKWNMVKSIDGKGKQTILSYDEFNLVIEKLTPNHTKTNITYNNLNKKTHEEIILWAGESVTAEYEYDILDNITKAIQDIDTSKTLTSSKVYDTNSRVIEEQTGSGAKILSTYDENGLVLQKTIQAWGTLGNITTNYLYDSNERLISETSPKAKVTSYEYDLFDRIIQKTLPNASYERYTYDKVWNIIKVEIFDENDVLLSKEENIYDKRGKVLENKKHILSNSSVISLFSVYDENGNMTNTIDGNGKQTLFTYDVFDRVIETQDSLWNKIVNTYDKNNNIISKSIIQSNLKMTTTSYTYDDENRLLSETNHLNNAKSYTYNKLNQVISITDEEGNITHFTYNYAGKILSETKIASAWNIVTSYTYDERWNMLSVTDGEWNITYYVYDNVNQLIKQIYPDSKEVMYVYDKIWNLISKTDPNGSVINSTYDNMERLISKNIVTGSWVAWIISENYSYDSLGRLVSSTDSNNHTLSFNYDSLNRLVSETQSGSVILYTYDNNNNLLSITSPNSKVTNYIYDDLNRVTQVKLGNEVIAEYTYAGLENTSIDYGNNTSVSKTYDALMRITSLNNGVKNYTYSYDNVSNIISDSHKNYSFDDIYRLTQVNESLSWTLLESFEFDKVWNRLSDIFENEYNVNSLNQYTSLSWSINHNLIYDNNGNLIDDGEKIFTYDYKNRFVKVEDNSWIIAQFKYDILGRRYEKQTSSETITYIYSDKNILSEIYTTWGDIFTKNYINGLGVDNIIAVTQSTSDLSFEEWEELTFCNSNVLTNTWWFIQYGWNDIVDRCESLAESGNEFMTNIYYFHKNHLWSVVWITDNHGNTIIEYEYNSYGNFTSSWTHIWNTRLFTWREFDFEVWLYYNRARYYSAEFGRFISRDPIDIADDINLYAYVGNNPVMFVDLMGMEKTLIIWFIWRTLFNYWEIPKDEYQNHWVWMILDWFVNNNNFDTKLYYSSATKFGSEKWDAQDYIIKNKDNFNNLVIVWHSLWADNAVELSNSLNNEGIQVNLLLTIDLQAYWDTTNVKSNTLNAVNYYQTHFISSANWDPLKLSTWNNITNLKNIKTNNYCDINECYNWTIDNETLYHTNIDDFLYMRGQNDINYIINK